MKWSIGWLRSPGTGDVSMSEFLEASACKGRRPDRVAIRRLVPRPDLIARLLRERHVARFLVAPDGFGKTTLACEYADTVFSFEHVFWVNGRSPCFLRDLDRGIIATRLCSLDPSSFLVVFEDVPRLDSARAERFSRVIDDVLEAGDEVLVTCVPSCDAYAGSHRDRTKLDAADLLLSDAECRLVPPGESQGRAKGPLPPAERVACLRWGSDDGTRLLGGIAREELPGDVMLALFAMLALPGGRLVGPGGVRALRHRRRPDRPVGRRVPLPRHRPPWRALPHDRAGHGHRRHGFRRLLRRAGVPLALRRARRPGAADRRRADRPVGRRARLRAHGGPGLESGMRRMARRPQPHPAEGGLPQAGPRPARVRRARARPAAHDAQRRRIVAPRRARRRGGRQHAGPTCRLRGGRARRRPRVRASGRQGPWQRRSAQARRRNAAWPPAGARSRPTNGRCGWRFRERPVLDAVRLHRARAGRRRCRRAARLVRGRGGRSRPRRAGAGRRAGARRRHGRGGRRRARPHGSAGGDAAGRGRGARLGGAVRARAAGGGRGPCGRPFPGRRDRRPRAGGRSRGATSAGRPSRVGRRPRPALGDRGSTTSAPPTAAQPRNAPSARRTTSRRIPTRSATSGAGARARRPPPPLRRPSLPCCA